MKTIEVQSAPLTIHSVGTVSATSNGDLSTLQSKLNAKANEAGATSYRIIGASGNNQITVQLHCTNKISQQ